MKNMQKRIPDRRIIILFRGLLLGFLLVFYLIGCLSHDPPATTVEWFVPKEVTNIEDVLLYYPGGLTVHSACRNTDLVSKNVPNIQNVQIGALSPRKDAFVAISLSDPDLKPVFYYIRMQGNTITSATIPVGTDSTHFRNPIWLGPDIYIPFDSTDFSRLLHFNSVTHHTSILDIESTSALSSIDLQGTAVLTRCDNLCRKKMPGKRFDAGLSVLSRFAKTEPSREILCEAESCIQTHLRDQQDARPVQWHYDPASGFIIAEFYPARFPGKFSPDLYLYDPLEKQLVAKICPGGEGTLLGVEVVMKSPKPDAANPTEKSASSER